MCAWDICQQPLLAATVAANSILLAFTVGSKYKQPLYNLSSGGEPKASNICHVSTHIDFDVKLIIKKCFSLLNE